MVISMIHLQKIWTMMVPDRYDNDFRDSDYFETTYDVEDNLNARVESKEKVSKNHLF